MVSLFIFPIGPTALDYKPRGRYVKNMIYNRNRLATSSYALALGRDTKTLSWKEEYGNHSLGLEAQNMHQLRVLGAK